MNPSDQNGGEATTSQNAQPRSARIVPEGVESKDVAPSRGTSGAAAKDSRYISVPKLPSNFIFYPFDTLSIRRFELLDLKKLYYAHVNNDVRALVEVLNSTIDRDAYSLTAGDYWYLMYWQRINSYPKNPFRVEFHCKSKTHEDQIKKAGNKELRDKLRQGLKSVLYLKESSVKLIEIENPKKLAEFATDIENNSDHRTAFYPARMIDFIDSVEMLEQYTKEERDEAQMLSDPEQASLRIARKTGEFADEDWWNDLASNIHPKHGETLNERRSYLEQLSQQGFGSDFIADVEEFQRLSRHGVVESIVTKCEVCGEPIESPISIDSLSFFPDLQ